MENIIIPGWVWGLFSVVIVAWLIRLTFMAFKASNDQTKADGRDDKIFNNISHLEVKIDETKRDFHASLHRIENRFEKFEGRMDKVFDRVLDVLSKIAKQ